MIEGPLSGATASDSASASDVTALELLTATHSGQIGALQLGFNGLGNSFYTKVLTDGFLGAKQDVIAAGDLTIDRTASLQTTLDAKAAGSELVTAQGTISTHTSEIASLGSTKQATLSNNGGAGIPLLNGVELRQVQAVAPLSAAILYDFGNPGAPNNNNLELSVDLSGKEDLITDGSLSIARTSGLQSAIDGKQPAITTATFAPSLTTFSTPVLCSTDVQVGDLTANAIYGTAVTQITSAISAQTALCVPNAYGATVNATSYAAKTGTWYESSTAFQWSTDLRIGGPGYIYSATSGVNVSATETVTYNFPAGYQGGTCYLNHSSWNTSAYFDVFVCLSTAPANDVFCCRVGDSNSMHNGAHGMNYDGVRVSCVASGYHSYDQVKIVARKGRIRVMGLAFSKEQDRPVTANSICHSDNIVGDPASLSDSRLKSNQVVVPTDNLTQIFSTIETKEYDLHRGADIDGTELPSERRVGFIANDVQAAIADSGWSNIVSSKMQNGEDYLTLDYGRLVVVLWGHVKALTARVAALEA